MNSLIQALHNIEAFRQVINRYGSIGNNIASTLKVYSYTRCQTRHQRWMVHRPQTN